MVHGKCLRCGRDEVRTPMGIYEEYCFVCAKNDRLIRLGKNPPKIPRQNGKKLRKKSHNQFKSVEQLEAELNALIKKSNKFTKGLHYGEVKECLKMK